VPERPSFFDRYPDQVTCVRCLDVVDSAEVDRLLWCIRCRALARNRASWWGWVGGWTLGAVLAAYVWFAIRPTVLIGGWLGVVAAAIWMGSKVTRELVYGAMRLRNARAVEAIPPGPAEGPTGG